MIGMRRQFHSQIESCLVPIQKPRIGFMASPKLSDRLLAPAHGRITQITMLEVWLRIPISLSVFSAIHHSPLIFCLWGPIILCCHVVKQRFAYNPLLPHGLVSAGEIGNEEYHRDH
jgi:hypothetical protein